MISDDVRDATISGGLSGAGIGLTGTALAGGNWKQALRSALMGALAGGTVAGGGVGTGSLLMGESEPGEINPSTRRGILGGGLAGGGLGALASAALAKKFLKVPPKEGVMSFLGKQTPGKAALYGGTVGAGMGAAHAGDEGMQIDAINNELDALNRRQRAEKMVQKMMNPDPGGFNVTI